MAEKTSPSCPAPSPDSDFKASHRICTCKSVNELLGRLGNPDILANGTLEAAIEELLLPFKNMSWSQVSGTKEGFN